MRLRRYFYHNYGGHIVHQFKGNGLQLVIHEAFFDIGEAYKPVSELFVRYWYAKKLKKIAEGFDWGSLKKFLDGNEISLLDEDGKEVFFQR